jgi:hypothetical protein
MVYRAAIRWASGINFHQEFGWASGMLGMRFKDNAVNLYPRSGGGNVRRLGLKRVPGIYLVNFVKQLWRIASNPGVAGEPHRSRFDCHNLHGVKWRGMPASKLWRFSTDPLVSEPK